MQKYKYFKGMFFHFRHFPCLGKNCKTKFPKRVQKQYGKQTLVNLFFSLYKLSKKPVSGASGCLNQVRKGHNIVFA